MIDNLRVSAPSLEKENTEQPEDSRLTQTRIRVQIPRQYHQEPVISYLASHYGLQVNILAALLTANSKESGWFELELRGSSQEIDNALIYLSDLNVQLWPRQGEEQDGW
ncbi:NIL domain-containing protein [Ancylothrix sp. C2]|uniref:NIL domain-containing protein n=1 Tax=Ancylothrix sp. D3o TaxID=2953691 RepID=UPI0021BAB8A2|nr:NIL domain-containing protein [Ancylothrix sp. D3o]MCT7950758.1 NIL domain-containing protein [Ancylothrix sp. D3o]